jgi:hypothetical protein
MTREHGERPKDERRCQPAWRHSRPWPFWPKRGAVDEARRRGGVAPSGGEWIQCSLSPCTLHFALARHIRDDAAVLGTMFLLVKQWCPKQWEAPVVVHFRCEATGRYLEAQCCGAGPPPGLACPPYGSVSEFSDAAFRMRCAAAGSWEVGFPGLS